MYRLTIFSALISILFVSFVTTAPAFATTEPVIYSEIHVDISNPADAAALLHGGFDIARWYDQREAIVIANSADRQRLVQLSLPFEVEHEDMTAYNLSRLNTPTTRELTIGQGSMGGYFTHDETIAFIDSLHALYPTIMSDPISIGQTIEGFDIMAYKISDNPETDEDEPEALYTGLHHAREPMSIIAPLYFTQWLLENYGTDQLATYLVDEREIWIVPIVNIDGYRYNEQMNPNGGYMWRKNKRDNNNDGNFDEFNDGVDLNRNYGYEWGYDDTGSSPDPTSAVYRGSGPFSEPETEAIRQFCNQHEFRVALNFHTYGDLVIQPWGYNDSAPPHDAIFKEYALDMIRDSQYVYGYGSQTVGYVVNGNTDDWMYGAVDEKPMIISYTPEIGHDGDNFWAPTDRILPLAQENLYTQQYAALVAGPYLAIVDDEFNDFNGGDGDFAAEAGETVTLLLSVRNKGWHDPATNITATLSTDDPYLMVDNDTWQIGEIDTLDMVEVNFTITIAGDAPAGHTAEVSVHFSNNQGYNLTETHDIILGSPYVVFFDNAENGTGNWDTGQLWNITFEDQSEGEYSFTDLPFSAYPPDWQDALTLLEPIDLSDMNEALLIFDTKWHIEDHWDLAQLQVSTDNGATWIPQATTHTSDGTGLGVQPLNEPVFNGYRHLKWLTEFAPLTDYLGESVLFRYLLASDSFVSGQGWFIDQILVAGFTDVPYPPRILFTTQWQDTAFPGPFPVVTVATDPQGISEAVLYVSEDGENFNPLPMIRWDMMTFRVDIPSVDFGTVLHYYVEVTDEEGNTLTDPVTAPAEVYSFLVTDDVQDIAIDTDLIEVTAMQGETVVETFEISNEGSLPLEFMISDMEIWPTATRPEPPTTNELDLTTWLDTVQELITQSAPTPPASRDDPPQIDEMSLLIGDVAGDAAANAPDVVGVLGEVDGDMLHLEMVFDAPVSSTPMIGIMSLDIDQNMDTGSYPPGLGIGYLPHLLGSEVELIWDPVNANNMGQVVVAVDHLGQELLGVSPVQINGNRMSTTFSLADLGDDDGLMDLCCIFIPFPGQNSYDAAPDFGHGTLGPDGDAPWLTSTPPAGIIAPGATQTIELTFLTELLEGEEYFADVLIESNDPDEPVTSLMAMLTLTPNAIEPPAEAAIPSAVSLAPGYPNPFRQQTAIRFGLPRASEVELSVYNVAGQRVRLLCDEPLEAGFHTMRWDGRNDQGLTAGSGIYVIRLKAGDTTHTQRLVLVR